MTPPSTPTIADEPWPPHDLASRGPRLEVRAKNTIFHRFHTAADPKTGTPFNPIYYDRSGLGRLNAPDGSYGVLYIAEHKAGAFAETFLRTPGRTVLPEDLIKQKAYVAVRATRKMTFVQFYGPGQPILGATSQVTSGPLPYTLPQCWSKAIHDTISHADGIAYKARHDNTETCYAVFERAQSALAIHDQIRDLDVDWFYDLMNHYSVGLS